MMRFMKVDDGLYRGSAPSTDEVIELYEKYGIRKIVSLDKVCADKIARICKMLKIKHVIIPIDMRDFEPIADLLSHDIKDLLINDGPTYVHCLHGKDRTGMVVAMYKCKHMGLSCEEAIKEAIDLGFGIGLKKRVVDFYEKIICMSCSSTHDVNNYRYNDVNSSDILDHAKEESSTSFDEAMMQSFSPYMNVRTHWPYNPSYDQYPVRDNGQIKEDLYPEQDSGKGVPLVGIFDNMSGIRGFGPIELGGGFVNT